MHLERISFFVSFAVLQILIDLINIEATKNVTITVEDHLIYDTTAQFTTFGIERFDEIDYRPNHVYQLYLSTFPTGRKSPITGAYTNLELANPITGRYINLEVAPADMYGGLYPIGYYPFASSNSYYGLGIYNPANFFGLWVSSADNANIVRFFYRTQKVFEYRVKNVLKHIPNADRNVFKGNPTYTRWWGNYGNIWEEYVFINAFFNGGLVYDYVQFVQEGSGCFESDNHSVGNWTQMSGRPVMTGSAIPVMPEPANLTLHH